MTPTSVVYLAGGILCVLIGAAIRFSRRSSDFDDGWSHPVSVGCLIIGIAGIAFSFIG